MHAEGRALILRTSHSLEYEVPVAGYWRPAEAGIAGERAAQDIEITALPHDAFGITVDDAEGSLVPRAVKSMISGYPRSRYWPLILPSLSNCETNAQRLLISFSFLMPAKAILVPGTFAFGSLMYSLNWASFQVMPEFLLASE